MSQDMFADEDPGGFLGGAVDEIVEFSGISSSGTGSSQSQPIVERSPLPPPPVIAPIQPIIPEPVLNAAGTFKVC